uniref:ubiquitinyl hydrolase 1 n=1 Tax=Lotharella oceanica TaxID=641309 RepID=A0A7S2TMA3_9EUKA|mmetsp:Transcript_20864/g.39167  ORF Transcript_20864/g.39167 Transcript_20864/m.39167 type:complete len:206 (+) Transcript_20864:1-618(+)
METVLSLGIAEIEPEKKKGGGTPGMEMQGGTREEKAVFRKMTIHVPKDEKPVALEGLIKRYFAEEAIPDYKCGKCNQKGACFKIVRPRSLPPVLIFQLKRFAPISMGVQIKCHRKVEAPEVLDMKPFLPSDYKDGAKYKLSSMVVHDGGMGGGHNMCYTRLKDASGGKRYGSGWFWFSDRHIGPVSQEEVSAAEPYILFYERIKD